MAASKKLGHRNISVIVGTVSRAPEVRELADGTAVVELEVRVCANGLPTVTVPVSWPGEGAAGIEEAVEVLVIGRVRRRFYRAAGSTVSRTDVLAEMVMPTAPAKRAATAMAAAAERVLG